MKLPGTTYSKRIVSMLAALAGLFLLVAFAAPAYAAVANDPFAEKQDYLRTIQAQEAWDIARENRDIVIAIVDTGVDLDHPDLKPNLVAGKNLIQEGSPPEDDNGHGTNVAGVIAAVGNNDRGVAGILWNAKIMPIKALEADGTGGEQKLGEGIRYAVDNGAKIVVLSLGLNKYSDYMQGIVDYAEANDVLLVAATGNDGNSVQYPAAYPTVLGVGGMSRAGGADPRSNSGPEVDVVAPWNVFTTAMGGDYEYKDGTSMAAPQVAAVAALIWSQNPQLKAGEVRHLIRQSAQRLGEEIWNPATGFGLLQADRALKETFVRDMYEPNDRKDLAKALSISQRVNASLAGSADTDWFYTDAPYDGTIHVKLEATPDVKFSLQHTDATGTLTSHIVAGGQSVALEATKGRSYVQLRLADRNVQREVPYTLTTSFNIYADPFENNDKQYKAFVLPSRSGTYVGTFHQSNDADWFEFPAPQSGSLRIRLSVDTARIDPVLTIQKQGEKAIVVDSVGDGQTETFYLPEVFPGSYFIKVSNVKEYANPIVGEYTLQIEYDARLVDPNEPNDHSYQATMMTLGTSYEGLIDPAGDVDWFQFRLEEESLAEVQLGDIPSPVRMNMQLLDRSMEPIASAKNASGTSSQKLSSRLSPGTYYIRLDADQTFDSRMYQLKVKAKPLVGGYADIKGHWAEKAILDLGKSKVLEGYGDYTFRPDQPITRAETTAVLSRAFELTNERGISYRDISAGHWAYSFIARASHAGIIDGYPDGTFAPDQPVTRMEMTAMLARSLNMSGKSRGAVPFNDVDNDYWGTPLLKQMKAEGWIGGYPDGSYRPDQQATRAELVMLLSNILRNR